MNIHELHQRALEAARKFFQAEAELLDLIQKIDACKGFRELGHASLFSYVVGKLKLSESVALNLINVARKAVQVPALKAEVQAGNLSVCKARKIVPVLNLQNQAVWIAKAKTLPTRQLEKEIAKVAPAEAFPERVRYATESRVNLSLSLDEQILEKIKRVQDLESQKKNRAVTLEETLAAMSAFYVEKNDPVEKAKRALAHAKAATTIGKALIPSDKIVITKEKVVNSNGEIATTKDKVAGTSGRCMGANTRTNHTDVTWHAHSRQRRENANNEHKTEQTAASLGARRAIAALAAHEVNAADEVALEGTFQSQNQNRRQPIPTSVAHEVTLRDRIQCTALDPTGKRCESKRWLHVHHIRPISLGGNDTVDNLTTLCSAHHKILHARLEAS